MIRCDKYNFNRENCKDKMPTDNYLLTEQIDIENDTMELSGNKKKIVLK